MRLIADLHISPRTVAFLRASGHDVVRADELLPNTASDEQIVAVARDSERAVLTQDLDFSAIVALSGRAASGRVRALIRVGRPARRLAGGFVHGKLPAA